MSDIFQEKLSSGHLWWKVTHYRYYRYSEGSLIAVPKYPLETVESLEK